MVARNAFLSELEDRADARPGRPPRQNLAPRHRSVRVRVEPFSATMSPCSTACFHHLISDIETSARAVLAERIKGVANAPAGIIPHTAFDDAIDVAGPVLSTSDVSTTSLWSRPRAPRARIT